MKNNKLFVSNITGINFKNPNTNLLQVGGVAPGNKNNEFLKSNNIIEKEFSSPSLVKKLIGSKNPTPNSFLSKLNHSRLTEQLVFLQKKGSRNANSNMIGYTYNKGKRLRLNKKFRVNFNKPITDNVYKILLLFFKSMYCLISKPVIIFKSDVVKIQLFYFVCLPKFVKIVDSENSNSTIASAIKSKNENDLGKNNKLINIPSPLPSGLGLGNLNLKYDWFAKSTTVKNNLKLLAENNIIDVYPDKFEIISYVLGRYFKKPVELELIRLDKPYYDSNIFVNYLALLINKRNISVCINRFFNTNIIKTRLSEGFNKINLNNNVVEKRNLDRYLSDIGLLGHSPATNNKAFLSGMNIKISGRLMREPILPRITTKNFEKGFTAKGKTNYSDVARFTHKNRKGAFTITVKSGQKF